MEHVFEPFFTTEETGKDSGLGLSMVAVLIKQSGGHITTCSEPGQGATRCGFTCHQLTLRPPPPLQETILVAENDADVPDCSLSMPCKGWAMKHSRPATPKQRSGY